MKSKWIESKNKIAYLIDAEDKYMERCLLNNGYQIRNWDFTRSLASPNGIAIDIGASIGMNSINYSQYFKSVEAFEPDPDIYECMLETLAANDIDNVWTHPVALSDKNSTATLVKFPRATFANTLKPIGYVGRSRPQLTIECHTLDSFDFEDVSFIKIDVEGWELAVLQGAEQTINKYNPVIQIEIKPQMLKRSDCHPKDIFDWFDNHGYTPHHFAGEIKDLIFEDNKISSNSINKNLVDFWFIKGKSHAQSLC